MAIRDDRLRLLCCAISLLVLGACHSFAPATPAPACPAPNVSTDQWRERRAAGLTYRIPDEYHKALTVGFNGPTDQWISGDRAIGFQFGTPANYIDVHHDSRVQDLTECRVSIGAHEADVVSFRHGAGYYARATWQGAGPRGEDVVFTGKSPDRQGQVQALAVIRSVRFLR